LVQKSRQRRVTLLLTGLRGAGKSTIAEPVCTELLARGMRAQVLDADPLRKHLNRDLGFSKEDREENVRRIGFVADLLTRQGVAVQVAAIRAVREDVR
jgi:adenylylsulfate kinase-like enzyme